MKKMNLGFLTLALVLGNSTAVQAARGTPATCTGPAAGGLEKLSATVEATSAVAKRLIAGPANFTRVGHSIPEGAVYSSEGKVLCILKKDSAAYAFNDDAALAEAVSAETKSTGGAFASEELCERLRQNSVKLTIPNGDVLNRLLWTIGEGSCNPVVSDVVDAKGKTVLSLINTKGKDLDPIQFATYYHGFALNNLRTHYKSEDDMLRKACNSGATKDFFKSYFEVGQGNTKPYFNLVLNPAKWLPSSAVQAYTSDSPELKVKHCMRSLLASVIPGAPDPMGGAGFWRHTDGSCAKNNVTMKVRMGGTHVYAHETSCCFREKF